MKKRLSILASVLLSCFMLSAGAKTTCHFTWLLQQEGMRFELADLSGIRDSATPYDVTHRVAGVPGHITVETVRFKAKWFEHEHPDNWSSVTYVSPVTGLKLILRAEQKKGGDIRATYTVIRRPGAKPEKTTRTVSSMLCNDWLGLHKDRRVFVNLLPYSRS